MMPVGAVSLTPWPTGILAWRPAFFTELSPAAIAEVALLAAGGMLLLLGAVIVTALRRWRQVLTLPAPFEHAIEPVDLLVGLLAGVMLPSLFLSAAQLFADAAAGTGRFATTQVASAPAAEVLPSLARSIGQAAGQLATVLVLLMIGARRVPGGLSAWGLGLNRFGWRLATAVLAFIALWPVCAGMLLLTRLFLEHVCGMKLPPAHVALLVLQSPEVGVWTKAVIAANAVLLAPLAEELFFRGLFQSAIARWSRSPWIGVAVSGLLFGAMHASVFDTMPTLAVLGAILAYAYARTNSLTLVILIHAVFNGKNVLQALLES
jgi:membrane protease YdiL (CAAX protease family)